MIALKFLQKRLSKFACLNSLENIFIRLDAKIMYVVEEEHDIFDIESEKCHKFKCDQRIVEDIKRVPNIFSKNFFQNDSEIKNFSYL